LGEDICQAGDYGLAVYFAKSLYSSITQADLEPSSICASTPREGNIISDEEVLNKVLLVPNPANNTFKVSGLDIADNYSLTIYDLAGKVMINITRYTNQDIDVNNLHSGSYIVHTISNTTKLQTNTKLSILK
jgi:hypothetical protein